MYGASYCGDTAHVFGVYRVVRLSSLQYESCTVQRCLCVQSVFGARQLPKAAHQTVGLVCQDRPITERQARSCCHSIQ